MRPQLTDLVEEQRATFCNLEESDARLRTVARACVLTEQRNLERLGRHRGAVDLDEWFGLSRAMRVNELRDAPLS